MHAQLAHQQETLQVILEGIQQQLLQQQMINSYMFTFFSSYLG